MKNLAKLLLGVGAICLVIGVVSKLINAPVLGSKPTAIFEVASSCLLLAIGLILAEEKK